MKKWLISLIIAVFLGGFFVSPVTAQDLEQIDNFDVRINLKADSSFEVTETIVYDFGQPLEERHGIYRYLPYSYQRSGTNYNVRLTVTGVTDVAGNNYNYTSSRSGGWLTLKIGEADKTITGQHTYVIKYLVERAINYFEEQDELYWNVSGTDWPVDIASSTVSINLPQEVLNEDLQFACYTGEYGATESDCNLQMVDESNYVAYTRELLNPGEGFTIVMGLPKGVLIPPSFTKQSIWFLKDNWYVFLPIIIFIVLMYIWLTKGRDPKTKLSETVIPYYSPPEDLEPGLLGVIYDETADLKDISSSIIDFAVRGFLKIKELKTKTLLKKSTDYEFIKLKSETGLKEEYEKEIFRGIFANQKTRRLSSLKNKFYKKLPNIKKSLYQLVVEQGYFPLNPDRVRSAYLVWGVVFIILGFIVMMIGLAVYAGVSVMVCGVLIAFFSKAMPRRTKYGVDTLSKILGLKMYLNVAEKDRIKFHNAPSKRPEVFEKLLPYAMVMGVEKEWS